MTRPKVLFVQYAQPAALPPVERAAHVLQEDGWAVRVLGVRGDGTDALADSAFRGIDVRRISRRGTGIVHHVRYLTFLLWSALHVVRWRPDWLYVSDTFATPIGLVARMLGQRVVYHEHDSPHDRDLSRAAAMVHRCRTALLRRASFVVTPNAERSADLGRLASRDDVMTVWNCPLRSEAAPTEPAPSSPNGTLRLSYHGSIVPGRPPMSVVEAVARASAPVELHITGYETVGSRGYTAAIVDFARTHGIEHQIRTFPPASRAEILSRLAAADLGLALIPVTHVNPNERWMAGASNKVFEYLSRGVPCLVSDLPEWRRIFVDAGVAIPCNPDDVDSILGALEWALANRDDLRRMGAAGRARILDDWNYEIQFTPVQSTMRRAISA